MQKKTKTVEHNSLGRNFIWSGPPELSNSVGPLSIASISVPPASEISVEWNSGGLAKAGLNKAVIKDAFDTAAGGPANVEWFS